MGTVVLRQVEGLMMTGTDSSGHSIVIGKTPGAPQSFIGMKPSDLLLLSAAACSAYDVIDILAKQRVPLVNLVVRCEGDQQNEPPYMFTHIHLHYEVEGDVDAAKLERAIKLSEEKYCSVLATLRPGVPISSDYKILPV